MLREGFIFYRSYAEALADLENPKVELELYRAIIKYGTTGEMPELSKVAKAMMRLIKPQLDANLRRYENGKKGGRKNQTETEDIPKENQTETKTEPNGEVVQPKEKDKVKDKAKENDKALSPISTDLASYIRGIEQKRKELAND